jgi:hypothetical protein
MTDDQLRHVQNLKAAVDTLNEFNTTYDQRMELTKAALTAYFDGPRGSQVKLDIRDLYSFVKASYAMHLSDAESSQLFEMILGKLGGAVAACACLLAAAFVCGNKNVPADIVCEVLRRFVVKHDD